MKNYRLTLSYDGSRYKGWQRQGNTGNTLQEKLETALSRILEHPIEIAGSGRTDAGAHARRQEASFRAETDKSCAEILSALRQYLPEDIGALALKEAGPRFHARLSCVGKTYVYRIWNSELPCVFERKYVYPVPETLDIAAMERAAALLCGKHDYAAFCTGKKGGKSTVRTVESIRMERVGEELRLHFTGDGFLYNMVRILTGTLIEVGRGQRDAGEMPGILASLDRTRTGFTAPAKGLCLWDVRY